MRSAPGVMAKVGGLVVAGKSRWLEETTGVGGGRSEVRGQLVGLNGADVWRIWSLDPGSLALWGQLVPGRPHVRYR